MLRLRPFVPFCFIVVAFALGAASACSSGDTAPAAAVVSVTPSKPRVTIGGPVDFTYRFEVAPGATFSGDYMVFVQVQDAEGDVFWSDDHMPPTPTSSWKPGQVVEYARTAFVPALARTGDAVVRVGLYKDDERLPLQGPDEADRASRARSYRVATLQIAPESERTFLIYKTGWYAEETPPGSTTSWKWTQRSAVLAFENPKSDVTLFVDYAARPDNFPGSPQTVTIMSGDQPIHSFKADSAERRLIRVVVPAAALGTSPMAELRLEVDRTFVPAAMPAGGQDSRELGIRVYQIFVDGR